MEPEREEQHRRLTEPHRSRASKIAWKRHRNSYNQANRKKERDYMNKTFYGISKELEESINKINEAKLSKDDVFDLNAEISFDYMSGGIGFRMNKETQEVSFSTALSEVARGNYKLENNPDSEDALKALYEDLKDELSQIAKLVDDSLKQILAKHGLRET